MYPDYGYDDQGDSSVYAPYSHGNPQHITLEELGKVTPADYGWTPATIKNYMFGVKVVDPETGQELDDTFYEHVIDTAVAKAEKELDIAILPRLIKGEHHDFHQSDFNSFMYTHTYKRPIVQAEGLKLEINGRAMYNYPSNWWKVYSLAGHIELYPTALMQTGIGFGYEQVFQGYPQLAGMPPSSGQTFAPQMVHVDYIAGLLPRKNRGYNAEWECPADLEQLVIKYAMKEVFQIWGRLIIGAGIAGKTLSIDGISESIQTTQSAMYGGASADIKQIDEDIDRLVSALRSYFGMNLGIV